MTKHKLGVCVPYRNRELHLHEFIPKVGKYLKEQNSNYQLSYLVATDTALGNQAWVLGYIEENLHPYFFVLHTSAADGKDLKNRNINLLKSILVKEGFFKGVR